jgi:D-alanyl-D-alanine carboxypeptidase (penicillin-binding protein 5/6)
MSTVYVTRGRRRQRNAMVVLALCLVAILCWRAADVFTPAGSAAHVSGNRWSAAAWPPQGSAAVAIGDGPIHTSGLTRSVPIASLAKVMTALVVLRSRPIAAQDPGFTVTITSADVADTQRRRAEGQSVVAVVAGERLTELQALQALLLPSANNIAMVLARAVAGNVDTFVGEMNAEARGLGMKDTVYTDPSGYDPGTVSTPHDQILLARAAMRVNVFAEIVAEPSAALPVTGVVHNTDDLLGRDGFVGIKTGSDSAAGGCFMFATHDRRHGQLEYGVVLGQRGGALIPAALNAAQRLAGSV